MQAMAARAGNSRITCPAPILRGVLFALSDYPQGINRIPFDVSGASVAWVAAIASGECHLLQGHVYRLRSTGSCIQARDRCATSTWESGRYRRRRER